MPLCISEAFGPSVPHGLAGHPVRYTKIRPKGMECPTSELWRLRPEWIDPGRHMAEPVSSVSMFSNGLDLLVTTPVRAGVKRWQTILH
jgi:hypothetical protein